MSSVTRSWLQKAWILNRKTVFKICKAHTEWSISLLKQKGKKIEGASKIKTFLEAGIVIGKIRQDSTPPTEIMTSLMIMHIDHSFLKLIWKQCHSNLIKMKLGTPFLLLLSLTHIYQHINAQNMAKQLKMLVHPDNFKPLALQRAQYIIRCPLNFTLVNVISLTRLTRAEWYQGEKPTVTQIVSRDLKLSHTHKYKVIQNKGWVGWESVSLGRRGEVRTI